ncbi:beta-galactosidase [Domibacillus sp. PGB-M46]|uniref:beta-galactosidase n=1 Tax=Domibacillus sp. PGB-M46 TaxID=2910255 RepID=UPI001F597D70|nr:beta-galactosidase [Domibacillus sp. PGB-M46]MCI2253670.1 beta-galactosidase [Domibacillus sp. PGB-M46]
MADKLYHGACFYPELWDDQTIAKDIERMKETGINVVRIGEFAWSKMEPEEGKIDVGFFTNIINRLYENGIDTVLCTPTPTPPIWFSHGHPERMHVDQAGRTMTHGSRQHACTNNAHFRKKAAIITEALAKEAGRLPGVIAWQLDNEFKCHIAECMCASCKSQWHQWLEARYGTIEQLNEDWGTHIWSEYYQSFEQVPQPAATPFLHHSSLQTMYRLFESEKIAGFADEQASIIRRYSKAPITHNSTLFFSVDNERLFKYLDFASFDTYAPQEKMGSYLLNCDVWRGLKKNTPFWVMETSTSYAASLESYANPHQNGYLRSEAVAAYALGGQGFCYWLWRQQRTGSELPHSAVISAWGEPSVGYENVLQVEEARKKIESAMLATKPVQADIAITYSDRARMFHLTEPHNGIHYKNLMTDLYNIILQEGFHRDVLPEGGDLTGYKLLFTPLLPYVSDEYLEKAKDFVEAGGIWIAGPMTGGRTKNHTIHTDRALGRLEEWAGVRTLFTFPMDEQTSSGEAFGLEAPLGLWSAVFEPAGARVVGTVTKGVTPNKAFLTEHHVGKGKIVMLGSMPSGAAGKKLIAEIFQHYAKEAGAAVQTDVTPGTIVVPRETEDGRAMWVMVNMDGHGGTVTVPSGGQDKLKAEPVEAGKLTIQPYEYRIIEFRKEGASL